MSDDPIALLERELLDAARRRSADQGGDELSRRRALRRRLPGALALAASTLVVVVIAGGALLAVRGGDSARVTPAARLVAPWAQRLAVIRRPQIRSDKLALYRHGNLLPPGVVAPGSVRLARRSPWGEPILLGVQVRGSNQGQLVLAAPAPNPQPFLSLTSERVSDGDRSVLMLGHRLAGGGTVARVVFVVGAGVAKVRVQMQSATRTAKIVGNVAALQFPIRWNVAQGVERVTVQEFGRGGSRVRLWRPSVGLWISPNGEPVFPAVTEK